MQLTSLKAKLIALIGALGALCLVSASLTLVFVQLQSSAEETLHGAEGERFRIEQSNKLVFSAVMDSRGIYMSKDAAGAKPFAESLKNTLAELSARKHELVERDPRLAGMDINALAAKIDDFIKFRGRLADLALDGSVKEATADGNNDANRANRKSLNDEMNRMAEHYTRQAVAAAETAELCRARVREVALASCLVPLVGIALGLLLARRKLSQPIEALQVRIVALAGGDFNTPVADENTGRDELGEISRAVEDLRCRLNAARLAASEAETARLLNERKAREQEAESLAGERERVTSSIGVALARLSDKKLNYRMTDEGPEVYACIKADFNASIAQLEEAITAIKSVSLGVHGGAAEISSAANDLASRTEQQAATLEETATAIDQITENLRKTAASAKSANAAVATTRSDAEASSEIMRKAIAAMDNINASSREIGQIIGVIDEIAFQTNLLALNAGVEAARAGDAGRGFAVVASEVRLLAQRSSTAASQIKALISTSNAFVGEGVELVAATGKALERIGAKVVEIETAVSVIATNAQEQATGLQQINSAMVQIDHATQKSAAVAEEASAACRTLSEESQALDHLIDQFTVSGGAPNSVRVPPSPARTDIRRPKAASTRGALALASDDWQEF